MKTSQNSTHVFRLRPGDDLRNALLQYISDNKITAAAIVSGVGSLNKATLRFAGQEESTVMERPLEIVSITGTLGGSKLHIHLAVADDTGAVTGGHLSEGCIIRTTCEVVLTEYPDLIFLRLRDDKTGYDELFVRAKNQLP